jgi:hypothetical protein
MLKRGKMSLIMLFDSLSYFAVALAGFYVWRSFSNKDELLKKIGNAFGVNGIFYLIFAFLTLAWELKFLIPAKGDFILMSFVLTIVSSIILLYTIYKITHNRNLLYLFILFLAAISAINFSMNSFFFLSMAVSYLFMMIMFLEMILFSNFYLKKAGIAGLCYTITSMAFLIMMQYNFEPLNLPWFIPNYLMLLIFCFIFFDVRYIRLKKGSRKKNFILDLIRLLSKFLFGVFSITAFILLSTIGLHEFGHAMAAQYYGCEYTKAVIYDVVRAPHTETICYSDYNETMITLGGILSTFVIGIVFLLTGSEFTVIIAYLIFGFSLLIAYGDFADSGLSKSAICYLLSLGVVITAIAVVKLSAYYLNHQSMLKCKARNKIANKRK